ncbi:MAG TPA: hypothetical protein VM389_05540, partial [Phycisphaerae bacterium]|nr:hypothetical protein [Phycisphaerae bacterium]
MSRKDKDRRKRRRCVRERRRVRADSMPEELARLQEQARKQAQSHLEKVFSRLCRYDPVDLLATIGALQLVPENAERAVRLQAYAHVVTCSRVEGNRPAISYDELRHLFDDDPIGAMFGYLEDPVEHLFTHEVTFVGGGHIVFPGINASAPFVLSNLCKALFFHPAGFPDARFAAWAQGFIKFMLAVSDRIARQAGLSRGIEPRSKPSTPVLVPDRDGLRRLKQSVRFVATDLSARLRRLDLPASTLNQVCARMGDAKLDPQMIAQSPLACRPMVRIADQVICAVPGAIVSTITRETLRLGLEAGLGKDLCRTYSDAVWNTVLESLALLGHAPVPAPRLPALGLPEGREGLFTLDSDKL